MRAVFLLVGLAWMGLSAPASAQFNGCPAGFCGAYAGGTPAPPVVCGGFQGAGDIIGGASIGLSVQAWTAALCGTKVANICVSGTCADMLSSASTGVIVPQTINGTLCPAASTSACQVANWYNQPGGTDCTGSCDYLQTTPASRLVLTTTCRSPLTVCMVSTYAGSNVLNQAAGNISLSQPWTGMGVFNSGGPAGATFAGFGSAFVAPDGTSAGFTDITCDGSTSHGFNATVDGVWFSGMVQCQASTYNLWVNGTAGTPQSWTASTSTGQPYVGLAYASGSVMEYAELGVWKADKTGNSAALYTNQKTRLGAF